ncbi:MAG TPA: thioredoxin family protein [Alphaproteobacteria bacterium]|nr:thioredoxin family protein [Alphaproteobacteria bacterium]
MKKAFKYSAIAATFAFAFASILHIEAADAMDNIEKPAMEKAVADPNAMMMMKKDTSMEKKDMAMDKMENKNAMMMKAENNQTPFSTEAFQSAQASEKPFLIAFHKKGCPLCAKQQQALNAVYKQAAFADTKVLVVSYDNDTESLKKFGVGMQGTLILYKGDKEISRSSGLTTAAEIEKQIHG